MSRYPRRYIDVGISPGRLRELQGFCAQYREYQRRIMLARAGIEDRPERTSGAWHRPDPTGSAALHLANHPDARRVKLIEDSAAAVASPAVAQAILRSVADGARYEIMRPPIGERQFYRVRQAFFIELDRRLIEKGT